MPAEWDTPEMWRKWVERTLYELGSTVRGMVPTHADRIADVVEQLHELRKEVETLQERMDKASEVFKNHVKKDNGGTT